MEKMNFYKDKKIFLTGHTGFKGTWLSLMLEKLGAKVYGYALKAETEFPSKRFTTPITFVLKI